MRRAPLLVAAALAAHSCVCGATSAAPGPATLFWETFESGTLAPFVLSQKSDYAAQPVAVTAPLRNPGVDGDLSLVLQAPAKRYAVFAPFPSPVTVGDDAPLIFQYEVRLQDGQTCGGAYVKLANASGFTAATADADTPYVIMFGPDICGATNKVHFIIRIPNPVTGEVVEHHLANPPAPKSDALSHVYSVAIRPDDTYEVRIDGAVAREGSLGTDLLPPVQPPARIADPADRKPADWVDAEKIPDPAAVKPDDWDESAPAMIPDESVSKPAGWLDDAPEMIPDPNAAKPEGWDDEEDGDFIPPMVRNPACEAAPGCGEWVRPQKRNPAYKGKWSAPLIANPAYKGVWAPRQIDNPAYYEVPAGSIHRLAGAAIGGVGVEVWTMSGNLAFDNFLLTNDEATAAAAVETHWKPKHAAQVAFNAAVERNATRSARLAAAADGGWQGQLVYYVLEARDIAVENPVATLATAVALLAGVGIASYRACCKGALADVDDGELRAAVAAATEEGLRARAAGGAAGPSAAGAGAGTGAGAGAGEASSEDEHEDHGHSHSHSHSHTHGHGHSHGVDSDDEDADAGEADAAQAAARAAALAAAGAAAAAGADEDKDAAGAATSGSGKASGGGARKRRGQA